jgi:multiple sugar transport system permease protein
VAVFDAVLHSELESVLVADTEAEEVEVPFAFEVVGVSVALTVADHDFDPVAVMVADSVPEAEREAAPVRVGSVERVTEGLGDTEGVADCELDTLAEPVAREVTVPVRDAPPLRVTLGDVDTVSVGVAVAVGEPLPEAVAAFETLWKQERDSPLGRGGFPAMPWRMLTTIIIAITAAGVAAVVLWFRKRPLPRHEAREERAGFLFASPWIIGFAVFMAFPVVLSLLLSFTSWRGLATLSEAKWVGVGNYQQLLLDDSRFKTSVAVTIYYVLVAVPLGQLLALGAALLMNQKVRGIPFFRAAWYLPSVLAGVGVAVLWRWVFDSDAGLMNSVLAPILSPFGLAPPHWFGADAKTWGAPAFAIMSAWFVGGSMMIYLAGLQGIPDELNEAAEVDGVGRVRRFVGITLPMLGPVILFNVLMAVIGSFQVFTQAFVMTGGEPGDLTRFYVLYLYNQGFEYYEMGYASAMAWILLAVVLVVTVVILRSSARHIYYEALKK